MHYPVQLVTKMVSSVKTRPEQVLLRRVRQREPAELTQLLADLYLVAHLILFVQQLLHRAPHRLGNLVHILRLNDGLQVILQDLGEVVLQLGAAEVL